VGAADQGLSATSLEADTAARMPAFGRMVGPRSVDIGQGFAHVVIVIQQYPIDAFLQACADQRPADRNSEGSTPANRFIQQQA